MKKLVTPSVLALLLISLSGCASYNYAPEWAQRVSVSDFVEM